MVVLAAFPNRTIQGHMKQKQLEVRVIALQKADTERNKIGLDGITEATLIAYGYKSKDRAAYIKEYDGYVVGYHRTRDGSYRYHLTTITPQTNSEMG